MRRRFLSSRVGRRVAVAVAGSALVLAGTSNASVSYASMILTPIAGSESAIQAVKPKVDGPCRELRERFPTGISLNMKIAQKFAAKGNYSPFVDAVAFRRHMLKDRNRDSTVCGRVKPAKKEVDGPCQALGKRFPDGIALNAGAAQRFAAKGNFRPEVHTAAFRVHGLKDGNSDFVVCGRAWPPPVASIRFGSSLKPAWNAGVSDYTVRCESGSIVADIAAQYGGSVTFDGSLYKNSKRVGVALAPGQRVSWTIRRPGSATITQGARCLPADFPDMTSERTGTPASQWYVFAPSFYATSNYVVVLDANGTPVWWKAVEGAPALDAKVLPSGQLAWAHTSESDSRHYVVNWDGSAEHGLGNSLGLDHHELEPTADGNYLAIRYPQRDCPGAECVDMTSHGGSANDTIIDGEVVEFDAAGNVLWTWNSRDHLAQDEWESVLDAGLAKRPVGDSNLWDVVHLNSVADDGDGVIISARHLNAVYRIKKSDGSVDWKLGGSTTANSLTLNGFTGPISRQHDARRLPNGHITVHDNGTFLEREARALEVSVNTEDGTATLVSQITDPLLPQSWCCGSARKLSTGGWVIGWGSISTFTETDGVGNRLLAVTVKPPGAFSYRVDPVEPGRVSRYQLVSGMDAMHPRLASRS